MKKQIKLRLIILALLVCITIPTVMAYMYMKTNMLDNQFEVAEASCVVVEEMKNNVKTSIKVKNTSNIDAYMRLIILTYWEDSKGNVVGRVDEELENDGNPIVDFNYDDKNWVKDDNIYYCITPVSMGELTPELFAKNESIPLQHIVDSVTSNGQTVEYEYFQVVEIIAEAIQAEPTKAVENSWNVNVNSSGELSLKTNN